MMGFLTVILFIVAFFLVVLVLVQPDRSNGAAGSFGGGAGSSLFGVSTDGGPLASLTEGIAALFIVLSLVLYILSVRG